MNKVINIANGWVEVVGLKENIFSDTLYSLLIRLKKYVQAIMVTKFMHNAESPILKAPVILNTSTNVYIPIRIQMSRNIVIAYINQLT